MAMVSCRTVVSFASYGWSYLVAHRVINQNRSTQRQPISLLQGSLESPFTRLSYGEGFMSQFEAVSEIQLVL